MSDGGPPSFTRAEIRAAEAEMIRLAHEMQAKNTARCAAADAARRLSVPAPQRGIPDEVRVSRASTGWSLCAAVLAFWAAVVAAAMLVGIVISTAL